MSYRYIDRAAYIVLLSWSSPTIVKVIYCNALDQQHELCIALCIMTVSVPMHIKEGYVWKRHMQLNTHNSSNDIAYIWASYHQYACRDRHPLSTSHRYIYICVLIDAISYQPSIMRPSLHTCNVFKNWLLLSTWLLAYSHAFKLQWLPSQIIYRHGYVAFSYDAIRRYIHLCPVQCRHRSSSKFWYYHWPVLSYLYMPHLL